MAAGVILSAGIVIVVGAGITYCAMMGVTLLLAWDCITNK